MNLIKKLTLTAGLLGLSAPAFAGPHIIDMVAKRAGVKPVILRAIAEVESRMNPYAMNINGESIMECQSAKEAINGLRHAIHRPWVIRLKKAPRSRPAANVSHQNCVFEGPGYHRIWFTTKQAAQQYLQRHGLRTKVRKANIASTDFGLFQINWFYHNHRITDAEQLFDPLYNATYGARYLSELIRKHGIYTAIGYYHNNSSERRQTRYRGAVINKIKELTGS